MVLFKNIECSSVHAVSKLGVDENGKPKLHIVIEFRKLIEKTVPGQYPNPDTSGRLASLGSSAFFSMLGFHQIIMCEQDKQKSDFSISHGKYKFCRSLSA